MDQKGFENKGAEDNQPNRIAVENASVEKNKTHQWLYVIVLITFFGVLISLAFGIYQGYRIKNQVANLEETTKAFNEDALRDSTTLMQPVDVQYLVEKSTKEFFDTYVSSQDTMLSLLGIIITALVTIMGIAVPVIMNIIMRNSNEQMFQHKIIEVKKRLKEQFQDIRGEIENLHSKLKEQLAVIQGDIRLRMDNRLKEIQEEIRVTDFKTQSLFKEQINVIQDKIEIFERIAVENFLEVKYKDSLEIVEKKKYNSQKIKYLVGEIKKNNDCYPAKGYYKLGCLYLDEGDCKSAKESLEKAVQRNPIYAEAYHALAKIHIKEAKLNEAWVKIEKALAMDLNYNYYKTRCEIFIAMGRYDAAKNDIDKCYEMAKENNDDAFLKELESMKKQLENMQGYDNDVERITANGVSFQMKRVSGGAFAMGSTKGNEATSLANITHSVLLSDYYIGVTTVTQELWEAIMGDNPSFFNGKKLPVEQVSWDDCQVFIDKLNEITGRSFHLPTEAQWEFAARGGNKSKGFGYSGSDNINDVAWYWKNSGDKFLDGHDEDWDSVKIKASNSRTHPVQEKLPNELGLYDMSGNVWEWCMDCYGEYGCDPQSDPLGSERGIYRVVRGGSWFRQMQTCHVFHRDACVPSSRIDTLGFRLAHNIN